MATKVNLKTTFEAARTIEPIYTGGDVSHNSTGTLIASCVDEDVLVFDVRTGKVLCRIEGDGESVTSLCLAPDASHLALCSRSLSMRIFALTQEEGSQTLSSKLLRTLKPHNTPVVSSAIDSTGSLLATGGTDGTVKGWDIRGGYVTHTFHGHGGVVSALKFLASETTAPSRNTDGKPNRKRKSRDSDQMAVDELHLTQAIYLASGGEDGKIRVWNLETRKSVAALDSHVSVVRSLDHSADQQLLLSASRDRTIILWNTQTWKQLKVIPALEVLETAGFIGNDQYCYAGGEHGAVRVWDVVAGREVTPKQKPGLENDAITSIIHIADDDALLSIHQDHTLRLRGISKLRDLNKSQSALDLPLIRTMAGNYDEVIDMACVGPDRTLLALATNTESVRLVSIADDSNKASKPGSFGNDVALLEGHEDIIICLDVDWSGHWLATGAKDNTARLWRLDPASSSYKCFATFAGHAESLGAIALPRSQPSNNAASKNPADYPPAFLLTGSQDKTIKRWDTARLKYTPSMTEPHSGTKAVFTRVAHEKDINAIDVSPSAPLFASASQDRTIKVWSLEDGCVTGILRGHKRGVWSIRFSPASTPALALADGGSSGSRGLLVSGSGDRTVKIWSLTTYTCLQTFEGHSNSVLKVLWLPPTPTPSQSSDSESDTHSDSHSPQSSQPLIASASSDTLVKLWSPYSPSDSDHLLATLDNHTDRVWALAAPNSHPSKPRYPFPLISGAADATLTFWRDTTVQTATLASQRATQRIEQDQALQNHIVSKNYREAITLSLALNHPARLLRVFQDVISLPDSEKDKSSIMGVKAVDDVLASLDHQQIYTLLERVRDWNTNARTAMVAQTIMNCLFRKYPASVLVDMAKDRSLKSSGGKAGGMKELLRALEVYTERHYKRMEELVDESYLIEYTLREMDEIVGVASGIEGILANGHGKENVGEEDFVLLE